MSVAARLSTRVQMGPTGTQNLAINTTIILGQFPRTFLHLTKTTVVVAMKNFQMSRQNSDEIDRFLNGAATFADMLWGFLDESSESSQGNLQDFVDEDCDDDDEDLSPRHVEENRIFWETQEQLLQVKLISK